MLADLGFRRSPVLGHQTLLYCNTDLIIQRQLPVPLQQALRVLAHDKAIIKILGLLKKRYFSASIAS
jgi:hypothetical protein